MDSSLCLRKHIILLFLAHFVIFEVLTAVTIKIAVLLDVSLCSLVDVTDVSDDVPILRVE
jgi:hypothetical protein